MDTFLGIWHAYDWVHLIHKPPWHACVCVSLTPPADCRVYGSSDVISACWHFHEYLTHHNMGKHSPHAAEGCASRRYFRLIGCNNIALSSYTHYPVSDSEHVWPPYMTRISIRDRLSSVRCWSVGWQWTMHPEQATICTCVSIIIDTCLHEHLLMCIMPRYWWWEEWTRPK